MLTITRFNLLCIVLAVITITIITLAIFARIRRIYKRALMEISPVEITKNTGTTLLVWQAVYQQSAETLRDQAKLLASTNIAGLAGAIAILSSANHSRANLGWLIASVIFFGIGLIAALAPITGLADKFKEDLSSVMAAMSDDARQTIQIQHAFPTGIKFYVGMLALALLGLGIVCLTKALLQQS